MDVSWTTKKAECQRTDAFELWCWRKLLRVPWTARRSNQSILKEISPGCSLEGLMLKLKLILWAPDLKSRFTGKDPDAGKDWRQEEKGTTEDEIVGWHHWLYGHELEQSPGVDNGQGSQACCSPWGRKESDMTEQLNWTELSPNNLSYSARCAILPKQINIASGTPYVAIDLWECAFHLLVNKQD